MYEQAKLAEAEYFYSRMLAEFNDRQKFTYNLSAFLSSARSVLQYALEEAKNKKGGQQWHDKQIIRSSVLSFFKDKRDINIHIEPVNPFKNTNVGVTVNLGISVSATAIHRDAKGNILWQSSSETPKPKTKSQKPTTPTVMTTQYKFADWTGSEDVVTLSQMYLGELENVVKDGASQGFITG